jgi:hypothetical protein
MFLYFIRLYKCVNNTFGKANGLRTIGKINNNIKTAESEFKRAKDLLIKVKSVYTKNLNL